MAIKTLNNKIVNINKGSICSGASLPYGYADTTKSPILQLQANVLSRQGILLDGSNNVLQWNDVRNKNIAVEGANAPVYNFTEISVYGAINESLNIKGNVEEYGFDSDMTFHLWFNTPSVAGTVYLMSKYVDTNNFWGVFFSGTSIAFARRYLGSYNYLQGVLNNYFTINEWHLLSLVIKGTNAMALMDGIVRNKFSISGTVGSLGGSFSLFNRGGALYSTYHCNSIFLYNYAKFDPVLFVNGDQVFTPKARNFPRLTS